MIIKINHTKLVHNDSSCRSPKGPPTVRQHADETGNKRKQCSSACSSMLLLPLTSRYGQSPSAVVTTSKRQTMQHRPKMTRAPQQCLFVVDNYGHKYSRPLRQCDTVKDNFP